MNTCAGCRYWRTEDGGSSPLKGGVGQCGAVPHDAEGAIFHDEADRGQCRSQTEVQYWEGVNEANTRMAALNVGGKPPRPVYVINARGAAAYARERMASRERMWAARAVVMDGSGYSARLLTRADFGCVLWEP